MAPIELETFMKLSFSASNCFTFPRNLSWNIFLEPQEWIIVVGLKVPSAFNLSRLQLYSYNTHFHVSFVATSIEWDNGIMIQYNIADYTICIYFHHSGWEGSTYHSRRSVGLKLYNVAQ